MIIAIVAAWVGFLALLVKLKVLPKWTLWMKISPVVIFLLCQLLLLIPMAFNAPSGRAVVLKNSVQIVARVSGMVVEVPIEGGTPLQKGDVLFRIDPVPFQTEVDRLEASLAEAQQNAKMLPADLAEADAIVAQSEAALVAAKKQVESYRESLNVANALVAQEQAQLDLAQSNNERSQALAESNATSQAEVDRHSQNLALAKASVDQAKSRLQQDQLTFDSQIAGVHTLVLQAEATLHAAQAKRSKAKIALEATINGENVDVAQIRAQLDQAKIRLSWTTVHAPSDGFVTGLGLRPGAFVVANSGEVMSFIDESVQMIGAQIDQIYLRNIEVGQPAEVIFKLYPGQVFQAQVVKIVQAAPSGQIDPSGFALEAFEIGSPPFWVGVELKDKSLAVPSGAVATVAIYTGDHKMSRLFRQLILRMENWLNYFSPD